MDVTLQPVTSQSIQVTWKVSEIEYLPWDASLSTPSSVQERSPSRLTSPGLLSCPCLFFAKPNDIGGKERKKDTGADPPLILSFLHPGSLMEICVGAGMKNLAVPSRKDGFSATLACPPNPACYDRLRVGFDFVQSWRWLCEWWEITGQDENNCPPYLWGLGSYRENRPVCAVISKGQKLIKSRGHLKNLSLKENHRGDPTVGQRNRSEQPCTGPRNNLLGNSGFIAITLPWTEKSWQCYGFLLHCIF